MRRLVGFAALNKGARVLVIACWALLTACVSPKAVVSVTLQRSQSTPRDASVMVDEEYVGPLFLVATQGLRLPLGKHRVTVTKEGYFPWDRMIEADRYPVRLAVELVAIPE